MKPEFSAGSSAKILDILYNYQLACCTYVAARLNIAELLFEAPRNIADLAGATDTDTDALRRVLKVIAAVGLFEETEKDVFAFTPSAVALHGEAEGSIKYYLQAILGEHYQAFGHMLYSVQTGKTAFDHYYKMDVWEYYGGNKDAAVNFNKGMAGLTQYYAREIIPAYDFSPFHNLVDIGGGNGALLFAILKANTHLQGMIFDAPHVIPETEALIRESGLQDRCTAVGGNFFQSIPGGMDAYMLKYILHDWNDEQCIKILRNCADAMRPKAKLLIFEAVIPEGNTYHEGKYTDVTMLVATRGRERNEADFRRILGEAGLNYVRTIPLGLNEVSIVEGEKTSI
jgi:hypothetical protein